MAEATAAACAARNDCVVHAYTVRCILVAVFWLASAALQQLSWTLSAQPLALLSLLLCPLRSEGPHLPICS